VDEVKIEEAKVEEAPAAEKRNAMVARWVIAAVGAIGVGVLTATAILGPTTGDIHDGSLADAAHDQRGCQAQKANLDFVVSDMNGERVRLDSYRGKVVLINFWATWCPPCKIEIPEFIELYAQYKDQGFVILGVSGDDDAPTLQKFAAEWKINYPMLVGRDEDKLFDAYSPILGYPTSVLVGRDGAVCGRHVGPIPREDLEKEIKALL
jgi:thiol-disulfide isomerase/thioredoxin